MDKIGVFGLLCIILGVLFGIFVGTSGLVCFSIIIILIGLVVYSLFQFDFYIGVFVFILWLYSILPAWIVWLIKYAVIKS